jgi:hypothetical protein
MPAETWNAECGKAIKVELTSEVPGLTAVEPAYRITYSTPEQFNGMFTYVKNILIVKIEPNTSTKTSVSYNKNVWAKNQVVMTITSPSNEMLEEYVKAHPNQLLDFFNNYEIDRAIAYLKKDYSTVVMEHVKEKFDIELYMPSSFTFYRDTTDFFWASNNANTGRMDCAVFTFPYTDPETFTKEYLVHMRDSVMKANIPGSYPDSYMMTNQDLTSYKAITVNGEYCGVLRGLWEMKNDMMGGPFVCHARLDQKNNRVVMVEGFVYAPETNCANFIRRLNAALYTLRLPGEFDESTDLPLNVPEKK